MEAKFDTTTDNKDQQTKLDVYVKNSDGQEVAKAEGNEGRWNKNSTHTVTLQIEGNPTKGRSRERQRYADSPPAKKKQMVVQLQSYSQVL